MRSAVVVDAPGVDAVQSGRGRARRRPPRPAAARARSTRGSSGVGLDQELDAHGDARCESRMASVSMPGVARADPLGGERARDAQQQSVVAVVGRGGGRRGTTRPRWRARAGPAASPSPGPRCRRPSTTHRASPDRIAAAHRVRRSGASAVAGSCPQERPQVWRSSQIVCTEARPGRAVTHRGSPRRRAVAERGAQRSTGVLVRQGVAGVFPRRVSRAAPRCANRAIRAVHWVVSASRAVPDFGPRATASRRLFVEAHVPAQQPQAQEDPRFPPPHAHQGGPRGAARPPRPRPEASLGLIWRVRDRATFEALAGARRRRAGPVSLRFLTDGSDDPPQVAYAIGRRFGTAVERNRARRRLRAAVALARGTSRSRRRLSRSAAERSRADDRRSRPCVITSPRCSRAVPRTHA